MRFRSLKKCAREMNLCSFCAACVENCAAFRATGWESYSSRGKIHLLKSRERGWFTKPEALKDRIYTCTLCRSCDVYCDAGYKPSEVFHAARVDAMEKQQAPEFVQKISTALQGAKNPAGLQKEARAQWVGLNQDLLDPYSKVAFFAGCNAAYKGGAQVAKVLRLLNAVGVKPAALQEEQCCGLVAYQLGNLPLTEALAAANIARLKAQAITQVAFLCPSCAAFFAEMYPALGQDFPVKPIMYFDLLPEHLPALKLKDLRGKKATYHDPCHLARYLAVYDVPRAILARTGAVLIEMEHNCNKTTCCGGGAGLLGYNLDRALAVAEARIRDAIATGASILVTPCSTCQETLEGAKFRVDEAMDLEVLNLLDLFDI